MSDMVERVARIVATARGCDDPESAKSQCNGNIPCPFCFWSEDAEHESGCVMWAEKIIAAMREMTPEMEDAMQDPLQLDWFMPVRAMWQAAIDAALNPAQRTEEQK